MNHGKLVKKTFTLNKKKIEKLLRQLLIELGENPDREGLVGGQKPHARLRLTARRKQLPRHAVAQDDRVNALAGNAACDDRAQNTVGGCVPAQVDADDAVTQKERCDQADEKDHRRFGEFPKPSRLAGRRIERRRRQLLIRFSSCGGLVQHQN